MSKLDVYANLKVNIDANGKVNNSDAKAEAQIIALDKISWLSTGMKGWVRQHQGWSAMPFSSGRSGLSLKYI